MTTEIKIEKKKTFPSTATLLMLIILICAILTYIIPAGEYQRVVDENTGRNLVLAGTFAKVEQSPVGFWTVLASVFNGMLRASDIIAFIFIVGGVFSIVNASGALNTALAKLITKLSGREYILVIIIMTAFAVGGATFGMGEETIPFVTLLVAVALTLGYDSIVGVSLVTVGVYAGYSAGPLNPFNTGIAHGIVELPIFSGLGLRTVLMVGALAIAIHHTLTYASKVKQDYKNSFVSDLKINVSKEDSLLDSNLTKRHKLVLFILLASLVTLVFGVLKLGWYFAELSGLFMLMGIVIGLVTYNGDFNEITDEFMRGATSIASAAVLVALSRGVLVVLEDGRIMDTIVYALSIPLQSLNSIFAAWGMYFAQGIINFAIPSSSGQAVVVMPIMGSLADVIGVTRQVAVLAYQCGDGFWNMITPTHPILMASLGIAGIPFGRWFKFAGPLVLKWSIWVLVVLAIGVLINWGPF